MSAAAEAEIAEARAAIAALDKKAAEKKRAVRFSIDFPSISHCFSVDFVSIARNSLISTDVTCELFHCVEPLNSIVLHH